MNCSYINICAHIHAYVCAYIYDPLNSKHLLLEDTVKKIDAL